MDRPGGLVRLGVIGLGYVGTITAACLAGRGHSVAGVDNDPRTVADLAAARSPVVEPGLAELVADVTARGLLRVGSDTPAAIVGTEVSLICVPTPSGPAGDVDTSFLERVAEDVGTGLAARPAGAPRHTVVVRSTMPPGTCAGVVVPRLEKWSGLTAGTDFGVAVHPEFLREGSGVTDFGAPARSVVGGLDPASADAAAALCADLPAPVFRVSVEAAEMIKYADNAFHALKVGFANEVAALAGAAGVDVGSLFEVFRADTVLNVSEAYLRPGFAFGGSCLPKDVRALVHAGETSGIEVPVLAHLLASNDAVLDRAVDRIAAHGRRRIGVLGLAVKAGTDDLRESPVVELCRRLLDRGLVVRAHDAAVPVGGSPRHLPARLPELPDLLVASAEAAVLMSDVVVVAHPGYESAVDVARVVGIPVVDLRHAAAPDRDGPGATELRRAG